ncbi:MAG: DUF547 domain-containing protein [Gammaproteobacteria bacterium]|nr:DUF547 domain-containing protein [Gammaproteobacteria bacterium]
MAMIFGLLIAAMGFSHADDDTANQPPSSKSLSTTSNSLAIQTPAHHLFDGVLHDHVIGGEVDYPGIAKDKRFNTYLEQLQKADLDSLSSKQQQLAFWINTYNALVIKAILDGGSPATFFGRVSFFKLTHHDIGGRRITLHELEHRILIPLQEPRIHFAIVCASRSCPQLRSEAFTATKVEEQLEQNAQSFINDTSRNRFDHKKRLVLISKIFDWFEKDFKKHSGSVQHYLARYVQNSDITQGLSNNSYQTKFLEYDWRLNGTPPEG